MNKKLYILLNIIFLMIVFSIGYMIIKENDKFQKNYMDNYPLLERQIKYSGIIVHRYYTHGRTFFEFKNGTKHSIPWAYNYNYRPHTVGDFLGIGDSILKPANSDTIFIFREDTKYYYVLEKEINK